jgi:hypothetical protein
MNDSHWLNGLSFSIETVRVKEDSSAYSKAGRAK